MTDTSLVIYHNARCSKSRSACELIAARGLKAEIIEYLSTPPSRSELVQLLNKLGMKPVDLVRRGEAVFKENFADKPLNDEQWLDALLAHPILIERPIVVWGDKAVIGRPPEKVLALIDGND